MRTFRNFRPKPLPVAAAILIVLSAMTAYAADMATMSKILVEVDKAELIRLPQPAAKVFIADPDIADVKVIDPSSIIVYGKKTGTTSVYAFSRSGGTKRYLVEVDRQTAKIEQAIQREVPTANVDVTGTPNGVTLSGNVRSPRDALALKKTAGQFLSEKEQMAVNVGVSDATQINLRVRVAEVSRTVVKFLGFNWDAVFNNGRIAVGVLTGRQPVTTFGNFIRDPSTNQYDSLGLGYQSGPASVSTLIDALQTEGLVTLLSEPNLTTTSGEPASFLAGGEFPVPVAQGLQEVTIEWKRFGVSVEFTPTVLDPNRISIKVRPEVSELSTAGAVTLDGITVPALTVRRADTTVELASGQSFAIAGLFQNNVQNQVQQMPWLGDLPVLGALFRSASFQRNESELVIIVTPYVVAPASGPGDLHLPTEGIVFASDLEQMLLGRLTTTEGKVATPEPASADRPHLSGAAGLILE
jgi:pilus assembly protein CpaC